MHFVILLWFSLDVIKLWTTTKDGLYLVDPHQVVFWLIFRFWGYFGHFLGFRGYLVIFLGLGYFVYF